MSEYIIGCFYFPISLSITALLAYLFTYKKKYNSNKLGTIYFVIILIANISTLTAYFVISNWLNTGLNYLSILGGITGLLISQLIGLSNKNLKKLTQSKKAFAPIMWQHYRKLLKKNKKNILRKKIKRQMLLISIGIFGILFISDLFINYMEYSINNHFDKQLDELVANQAKILPNELHPNYIFESVYKKGKTIYSTYTLKDKTFEKVNQHSIKKITIKVLLQACFIKNNKKKDLRKYTYIYIFNTANKKDTFRISVDQDACDNFQNSLP